MRVAKTAERIEARPLRSESVERAVEIHLAAFPGFFLAKLGPRVLRIFYREFAQRPDEVVAIEAHQNGEVVGVAVGPCRPGEFFATFIRRRRLALATGSVMFMLRHPTSIPRIFRAVRYRGEGNTGRGALLSSIAVDPARHGQGIGRILLDSWWRGVQDCGIEDARLTTDLRENEAAVAFYQKLGWTSSGVFVTPEGREMLTLTRQS